jgi:group I intron endonuclease
MELSKQVELSKQILLNPTNRFCEIYKITNLTNNKIYVGQAVSHILNHNKYRPYGREGRFRCHISEAFSNKKNQSHYLNNSIRKYGVDNFSLELLECCPLNMSDEREIWYINELNCLYPNGYNLKLGGQFFTHSNESKLRLSKGVHNYYKDKKFERFMGLNSIDDDFENYIKPLNRNNKQYGWYVYINRIKADFGGSHITLEQSKNMAIEFLKELKERLATHLGAGTS